MAETVAGLLMQLSAATDRGADVSPLTDALQTLIAADPEGTRAAVLAYAGDERTRLWAIGLLADPRDVGLLEAALADPRLRCTALEALAVQPAGDRVDALARSCLDDRDPRVRALAVGLVACRADAAALAGVQRLADDPDVRVRIAVAWRLALLGDRVAEPALRRLRDDPDEMVRRLGEQGLHRLPGS
jgi:HEAT repeat protein